MNVTLNTITTERLRKAVLILQTNSELGHVASHAAVVSIAVDKYLAELEQRFPPNKK